MEVDKGLRGGEAEISSGQTWMVDDDDDDEEEYCLPSHYTFMVHNQRCFTLR